MKNEKDAKQETNGLSLECRCRHHCQKYRSYHADKKDKPLMSAVAVIIVRNTDHIMLIKKDIPLILSLRAPFICLRNVRTLRAGP